MSGIPGGHIDTSLRGWATTLTSRVSAAAKGVRAVAVLPGGFASMLCLVRSEFLSAALHGCEASKVAQGAFSRFCHACASAVRPRKMPPAHSGTVLSLLEGPV